jgi:hypothetical protein
MYPFQQSISSTSKYHPLVHITVSVEFAPGKHLAHSTLTLDRCVCSVHLRLGKKTVDENGREIEPKREYRSFTDTVSFIP